MKDNGTDEKSGRLSVRDRPAEFEAALNFQIDELSRFFPRKSSTPATTPDTDPLSAEDHLHKYAEARYRRDLSAAIAHLNGALDKANTRAQGLYLVGLFHKNVLKEDAFARSLLEASILHDPTHVEACYSLGNLYNETGHYWNAEAAYRTVLALAPKHAQARTNLGIVQLREKRLDEAQLSFETAIAAYFNLAGLHLIKGDDTAAAVQISRGLVATFDSRGVQSCVVAARVLGSIENDHERFAALVAAVANELLSHSDTLFLMALTSRVVGKDSIAIPLLEGLIVQGKELAPSYAALAHSFARLGDDQKSVHY